MATAVLMPGDYKHEIDGISVGEGGGANILGR